MSETTVWRRVKLFFGLATCPELEKELEQARQEKEEAMEQLEESNKEKQASFENLSQTSIKAHETMQMNGQEGSKYQEMLKRGRLPLSG